MTLPDDARDLPASAKLVYRTLQDDGPMTTADLRDATGLYSRTVTDAVSRLEERDLVESRPHAEGDARQTLVSAEC